MNENVEKSFDLEQQILDCWTITSQIDTLLEGVLEHEITRDQIANVLMGLKDLYDIKFDKTFRTFEYVHSAVLKADKQWEKN